VDVQLTFMSIPFLFSKKSEEDEQRTSDPVLEKIERELFSAIFDAEGDLGRKGVMGFLAPEDSFRDIKGRA